MNGKKSLGLLIALLLLVSLTLSLVACSSSATTTTTSKPPTSSTPAASTTAATTAPAKVYKLTYALFQPATAALSVANTEYAKEIEKRTNGAVQISVMQAGSLLAAPAMYEGVKSGVADMGNCLTTYNPGNFPFSSITELPSAAQSGWAVAHAMTDFFTKYQPKEWNDVHLLTTTSTAAEILAVATPKSPIIKVDDWKGKTIRGTQADIISALGGTVKDVAMADLYDSLSKGVVDVYLGSAEPLKSWKLADVAKNVTLIIAPVQPSTLWYNIMNKNTWNSLPADIQKTITTVSNEYSSKLGLTWDDQSVAGTDYAKSVNANITVLSADDAAKYSATILPVVNSRLQKIISGGFTKDEVQAAWDYFQSRVQYWNGQQSANSVKSLADRLK